MRKSESNIASKGIKYFVSKYYDRFQHKMGMKAIFKAKSLPLQSFWLTMADTDANTETDKTWVVQDCVKVFTLHNTEDNTAFHWVTCTCYWYLSHFRSPSRAV